MNEQKHCSFLTAFLVLSAASAVFCSSANAWWNGVSLPSVSERAVPPPGMPDGGMQQPTPEKFTIQNLTVDPSAVNSQPPSPIPPPSANTNIPSSNPVQQQVPVLIIGR